MIAWDVEREFGLDEDAERLCADAEGEVKERCGVGGPGDGCIECGNGSLSLSLSRVGVARDSAMGLSES